MLIMQCMPLEFLTCLIRSTTDTFYKVWDPYLQYIGPHLATTLTIGFLERSDAANIDGQVLYVCRCVCMQMCVCIMCVCLWVVQSVHLSAPNSVSMCIYIFYFIFMARCRYVCVYLCPLFHNVYELSCLSLCFVCL